MFNKIGLSYGIILAITTVIGSGLLALPGLAIQKAGALDALYAWGVVIIAILPLIYIFSRLGVRFPSTAGIANYAHVAMGERVSNIVIWLICVTFAVGMPAFSLIGGSYIAQLFNYHGLYSPYIFAGLLIVISAIINLLNMRIAVWINYFCFIILLLAIISIVLNHLSDARQLFDNFPSIIAHSNFNYFNIWQGAAIIFWAFQGWENLSFSLAEVKKPSIAIPLIYWLSFIIVSTLYFILAWVTTASYLNGYSVNNVTGIIALLPNKFYVFSHALICLILITNFNSWNFGASRLIYSAGKKELLPSFVGQLSNDNVPRNSILFSNIIYLLVLNATCLLKIPLFYLITLTTQNFIVLYAITIISFVILEKSKTPRLVALSGLCSCTFLLTGFSYWIVIPFVIILLGYIIQLLNLSKKIISTTNT